MLFGTGIGMRALRFGPLPPPPSGGSLPDPGDVTIPRAQFAVPYNYTFSIAWPDGVYDLGMGVSVAVNGGVGTATGTPS